MLGNLVASALSCGAALTGVLSFRVISPARCLPGDPPVVRMASPDSLRRPDGFSGRYFPGRSLAGTAVGSVRPAGRRRKGEAGSSWRGTRLGRCARTVCRVDVIRCEGLTKKFGPAIVVNGLDLTVSSGQVYGFLGPNGAPARPRPSGCCWAS